MKERSIPFIAPMVHSVLDGTKTQTRRLYKTSNGGIQPNPRDRPGMVQALRSCPYGKPGDRLWVREAWRTVAEADALPPRDLNAAHRIWFEADAPHQPGAGRYRPGMFMPRWVSRITLEIADVRLERLQDISDADCIAEGCTKNHNGYYWGGPHAVSGLKQLATAKDAYRDLWGFINGPGSWDVNPWVWPISFKQIEGGAS